jgi:predicted RNA-binding protein with PIN domain
MPLFFCALGRRGPCRRLVALMHTRYLIDGYNLLYAMGILHGRVAAGGLERARLALIGLLRGALGDTASAVTVVFDAAHAPRDVPASQELHGIHVEYATGGKEADDVIEELVRQAPAPRTLTVVSDDHRVQQAARRRDAAVLSCGDFIDLLQAARRMPPSLSVPAEKQPSLSEAELAHWLKEFGHLQSDPQFRELFEKYGLDHE